MAAIARFFANTAQATMSALSLAALSLAPETEPQPVPEGPSPATVLEVKNIFLKRLNLPLEIVDSIIDFAEYWAHISVETEGPERIAGGRGGHEDKFIVSLLCREFCALCRALKP
jgi:hypothetical protein